MMICFDDDDDDDDAIFWVALESTNSARGSAKRASREVPEVEQEVATRQRAVRGSGVLPCIW